MECGDFDPVIANSRAGDVEAGCVGDVTRGKCNKKGNECQHLHHHGGGQVLARSSVSVVVVDVFKGN